MSLAEAIAADKDALADYLTTSIPAATVSSAALEDIPAADYVVLDMVTVPQGRGEFAGRDARPQVTGYVIVQRPEGGEAAIRVARRAAASLMGKVEEAAAAINKNPAAVGMTAMIGTVSIATSGLLEAASIWKQQAMRQAQVSFTISWMSHSS